MKKLVLIIMALFILFPSCRKKNERKLTEIEFIEELHCLNDQFDMDELGQDCGGEFCDPCEVNSAPCDNPDNRAYLYSGFSYYTKTFTSTSIDTTENGGLEFYAYLDSSEYEYLKFTFLEKPDVTKTYNGEYYVEYLESDEVCVVYHKGPDKHRGGGKVHITYENEAYVIECCDYSFFQFTMYPPQQDQWFNVAFN